jgi:hypothetical protein
MAPKLRTIERLFIFLQHWGLQKEVKTSIFRPGFILTLFYGRFTDQSLSNDAGRGGMQATPFRIYPTRSGTRIRQNRTAKVI